jgi:hypothetical protein
MKPMKTADRSVMKEIVHLEPMMLCALKTKGPLIHRGPQKNVLPTMVIRYKAGIFKTLLKSL